MKTLFVAPYVPSSFDAIKLAALYFDEVVLNERELLEIEPLEPRVTGQPRKGRIVAIVSAIDDRLREAIRPLIDEKVVRIDAAPPAQLIKPHQREQLRDEFVKADYLLYGHREGNPPMSSFDASGSGIREVHTRLVGPLEEGRPFHLQAVSTYFEGLFLESIDAALRGESVLSSSRLLYQLIERAATGATGTSQRIAEVFPAYVQPRLAMDVLKAMLIDPNTLDCNDVLEARYQLRDELIAFRTELQRLQFDFTKEFGLEKIYREGPAVADARLAPRVREIEGKIRTGHIRVLRRMLDALEKPGAYVPLVGSAFAGVPLEIALALSLGLVSTRVALEAWEEHQEVANDGLFYLVKMKKLFGHRSQLSKEDDHPIPGHEKQNIYDRVFEWPEDVEKVAEE